MRNQQSILVGLIILVFLVTLAGAAWAKRGGQDDAKRSGFGQITQGYVIDKRHHHDHYYPRKGYVTERLPRHYRSVRYRDTHYFYSGGVWYRPFGPRYTVIAPPVGVVVPVLPRFYTTVWFGGAPYYYAAGTYYAWYPEVRGYRVVEPPADADVYEEPETPAELFVYPKQGQSEELQAKDRYECHSWSLEQTGFDPTQPGGNVSPELNAEKRSDYNRATKACLEARGYSVQ